MTSLFTVLSGLFGRSTSDVQDRDAAYLAEAVDIHDLERRMRLVDSGRHNLYASGPYGIFMR